MKRRWSLTMACCFLFADNSRLRRRRRRRRKNNFHLWGMMITWWARRASSSIFLCVPRLMLAGLSWLVVFRLFLKARRYKLVNFFEVLFRDPLADERNTMCTSNYGHTALVGRFFLFLLISFVGFAGVVCSGGGRRRRRRCLLYRQSLSLCLALPFLSLRLPIIAHRIYRVIAWLLSISLGKYDYTRPWNEDGPNEKIFCPSRISGPLQHPFSYLTFFSLSLSLSFNFISF